jgi:hypothetical protein
MKHVLIELDEDGPDGERPFRQDWVSIDGDYWIPIDRAPVAGDTDEDIARIIDGELNGLKPLVFATRFVKQLALGQGGTLVAGSFTEEAEL